ncbi:MAG: ABC transporter permease [Acidimicrobiia bacterium]|nr:ABC transporter permease [Acidimicrobiia bacterium]
MSATTTLTRTESRLFLRDPMALFFGLIFPGALILALGYLFPGFDEPTSDLDGLRYLDVYAPMMIALSVATLGLVTLPPILGTYRQFGILRRLRTTPVHPARLLWAQLAVHSVVGVLAAAIAIGIAVLAFDMPFPKSPAWFVIGFILAMLSVFAIGLLIGALVRTTTAGQAIGLAMFFPLLFLGGMWVPRRLMPDGLLLISDITPLGSAVQALEDSWFGMTPSAVNILVMLAYAVVVGFLAVRAFRWE